MTSDPTPGQGEVDEVSLRSVQSLRRWEVVGGVVLSDEGVLLVANRRRNGTVDWTPPGGVVDRGESYLEALTREVKEETGISVASWSGGIYNVEVIAPDPGFHLTVHVYKAEGFEGRLAIDDPDGIVVEARFVALDDAPRLLSGSSPWVVEPLLEYLSGRFDDDPQYRYRLLDGVDQRRVLRLHD